MTWKVISTGTSIGYPNVLLIFCTRRYNVCIDEFSLLNGGTMFALGSALEGTGPPAEWSNLSIVDEVPSGPGLAPRRVDGVDSLSPSADPNYGRGKDRRAEQLEGPPGTAILYDARTWHRQHANLSDKPRTALLFVYTPRWVLPMGQLCLVLSSFCS